MGPFTSFAIAGALAVLKALTPLPVAAAAVTNYLILLTIVGVFNLAPGFPLEGGRLLRAALWKARGDLVWATRAASRAGSAFATLLIGIFVVIGIAAGQAGSAVVVSMVLAALMSLLSALSIADLMRWLPTEGSSYEIARRLLSPATGFLAGWMYIVSNIFTGAAVAIGFAHSLGIIVPRVPVTWTAALLCLLFNILNSVGIRQSARLNNILVAAKLAVLALFCALGLPYLETAHFVPFEPIQWGVIAGANSIFFAFGGAARVAVMAEDVSAPGGTCPARSSCRCGSPRPCTSWWASLRSV